jgi:hypothetical protein
VRGIGELHELGELGELGGGRHCGPFNLMEETPMATKPRPSLTKPEPDGSPARAASTAWVGAQFDANTPVKIIDEAHANYLSGGRVVSATPKPGSNPPVVAVEVDTTGQILVFDATQLEALA